MSLNWPARAKQWLGNVSAIVSEIERLWPSESDGNLMNAARNLEGALIDLAGFKDVHPSMFMRSAKYALNLCAEFERLPLDSARLDFSMRVAKLHAEFASLAAKQSGHGPRGEEV